ncbi:Titin [Eumeta japonica]|uniref:Titin n=1 Tax=Eumeta variegata TaxID=151549 RepID=A0A4C1TUB8_EUMVA|nr:Titin [Eumeta japonica]
MLILMREASTLEATLTPVNDPTMKVNGTASIPIQAGHRFKTTYDFGFVALDILYAHAEDTGTYMCKAKMQTTHDFGYVALDILYVYGEDTGTYMCKATNLLGEAVNTCNVRVLNRRSMILDTQHPDALEKIQKLESKVVTTRTEVSDQPISPPHFTAELRGSTEIYEGQTAHFEAQVQPVHDPNLRIEFYHNGKPLPSASRFHITFDFGYVALDIAHAVAEDAGEYSVRAVNALGQCVSSTNLRVIARVGDPNLKVEWYRNERVIEDSSRITKQHDFGFVSLDISHIRKEDEGVYMCRAVNPLGEAVTTASMRVVSEASIQLDTQHPDSISRIHQLNDLPHAQKNLNVRLKSLYSLSF